MRTLILIAFALLAAGQARASGSPFSLGPADIARHVFKRKPEPRDPVSRDELIRQEREYRQRNQPAQPATGAQRPPAQPSTREQRMAEALERARAQGVGQ